MGHIEQEVSIPCSMWLIRPVSVRWRYRNRRMERRGMGAAWATARPISRRGAIGAIGGAAAGSSGGRLRSRSWARCPGANSSTRARSGGFPSWRRPIGSWRLRSAWQIAAEKPLRAIFRPFSAVSGIRGRSRCIAALLRSLAPAWAILRSGDRALAVGARPGGVSGGGAKGCKKDELGRRVRGRYQRRRRIGPANGGRLAWSGQVILHRGQPGYPLESSAGGPDRALGAQSGGGPGAGAGP